MIFIHDERSKKILPSSTLVNGGPLEGDKKATSKLKSSHASGQFIILVGGFNPFEKYARQIGSFPQVGVKIKNI